MKKLIVYFLAISFLVPFFISCEDFLDTKSYTTKDSNSFPSNESDANQMLVGVYVMLNVSHADGLGSWFLLSELISDDRFGGGGNDDAEAQAISHLMTDRPSGFATFWKDRYTGIARATQAIDALSVMDDGDLKNQKTGEAKFLRAHWYFELVQALGNVPLMTELPQDVEQTKVSPPQATQEDIFKAIATDLWEAYSTMPAVVWNTSSMPPSGVVTKWAAAGLLARVYLFYTGFYGKTSLPREGGDVTNAQVVAALENLIDNSGHDLLPDFRTLWSYTNVVTQKDYVFAQDAPAWLEGSANRETIFTIKFNGLSGWSDETTMGYRNPLCLYFAPRIPGQRDAKDIFPMGLGWGMGPVNSKLWDEWPDADPRKKASIYNQAEESTNYLWGVDTQMEETGMWQKKVVATTAYGKGGNPNDLWNTFWSDPAYGNRAGDDNQMHHGIDLILIRFADILLMHSELTQSVTGINRVRNRVGLPPVEWSEANLRNERRWELAFEGLRWGDIRRWGIAEDALDAIYGVPIFMGNVNDWRTMKPQGPGLKARYQATKGFFPIPQSEIDLSNGTYKQNPGWDSNHFYNQWTD